MLFIEKQGEGEDDWLTGSYMCESERRQNFLNISTVPLVVALLKSRISEEDNPCKILQRTTRITHTSHMTVPVNFCILNQEEISTDHSS